MQYMFTKENYINVISLQLRDSCHLRVDSAQYLSLKHECLECAL